MTYISERSNEIFHELGGEITGIKADLYGVRVTNCIRAHRFHKPTEEDMETIAGINHLARENQVRAPKLIGIDRTTLDEYLED